MTLWQKKKTRRETAVVVVVFINVIYCISLSTTIYSTPSHILLIYISRFGEYMKKKHGYISILDPIFI